MKCPPYHWHGRRMPTDNRSESVDYGKNRRQLKLSFPASSLELLKHPGTQGNVVPPVVCLALPLSASSSRASTATTQPTSSSRDKTYARFLHPSSQTSSERAQELPTVPIFVTEKVHVGIERNRAIPTKWRTGSSRRCVGGSRHMVD